MDTTRRAHAQAPIFSAADGGCLAAAQHDRPISATCRNWQQLTGMPWRPSLDYARSVGAARRVGKRWIILLDAFFASLPTPEVEPSPAQSPQIETVDSVLARHGLRQVQP